MGQKPSGLRRLITCREREQISRHIGDNREGWEKIKVGMKLTVLVAI